MLKSVQFSMINQQSTKSIDNYLTLANATIDVLKQVAFVQCEATRTFMQNSALTAKKLLTVSSPKDFGSQFTTFAVNSLESGITKAQELCDVINNSKTVFAETASYSIKDAQEALTQSVGKIASVNPTFSKVAQESLQTLITTSNQAADTVSKVSAQVAEVANKNIQVATKATLNTVKKQLT